MDGQNFQNDQNDQNNQNNQQYGQDSYGQSYQSSQSSDPYTTNSSNNYYQDNTTVYASNNYTQSVEPAKSETPTLAIVSLVMGIASIVLGCCCGIGMIFAIAGIIMSVIAGKTAKTGVGTAGLICSIVGIVFSLGGLAYFIVAIIASM